MMATLTMAALTVEMQWTMGGGEGERMRWFQLLERAGRRYGRYCGDRRVVHHGEVTEKIMVEARGTI